MCLRPAVSRSSRACASACWPTMPVATVPGGAPSDLWQGSGRAARGAVQPRAWARRRPGGQHRIWPRSRHRPPHPQPLRGTAAGPADAMLAGLDAVVVDIQDVGVRFYTYATTMAYLMEEAAKRRLKVFVLDRPNPIGAAGVRGPMLDPDAASFIGYFRCPLQHAMTLGELAPTCSTPSRKSAPTSPSWPCAATAAAHGSTRRAWPGSSPRPICARWARPSSIRASPSSSRPT